MLDKIEAGKGTKVTREEILARAEALVPALRSRAETAEKLRMCPPETIQDYLDNGLLRVCQPARYGGYELGYDVLCEVVQTLARGCGSQAWVNMVLADNPAKLAAFPLEAQDEVWGVNDKAKICVAVAAVGKGKPVDGGIVWNGVHGFSSGIDHADWVICGGNIMHDNGKVQGCFVVIPTKQVRIIDDWHVMGLVGSGSKSFEVKDVFVPTHRILDKKQNDEGTAPGTLFYTAPVYKMPRGGVSAVSYTAAAVGVAEGFLAEYVAQCTSRKSRGNSVASQAGIQINIGQSSAEISAAALLYITAIRECMRRVERGEAETKLHSVQGKRDACFAAQMAFNAVQRLFNDAGGRALYTNNDLQRKFRDVYAASAHHSLVWHTAAGQYGQHVLTV